MQLTASLAASRYAEALPATAAQPAAAPDLAAAAASFAATLRDSESLALTAASGGRVDPHALVQALAQTELAVEAAVTIRNRVVEAYQEILRMPV